MTQFSERFSEVDLYHADQTWGSWADTSQIERTLGLMSIINGLPQGAVVADIGAGVALDTPASIKLQRPDIRVVAVDTGYRNRYARSEVRDTGEEVISRHQPGAQELLLADRSWQETLVAGGAEELPVRSGSVDFLYSHVCIPEHLYGDNAVYNLAVSEVSRVLKPGRMAVLGPYRRGNVLWREQVEKSLADELFHSGRIDDVVVELPGGQKIDGSATYLEK